MAKKAAPTSKSQKKQTAATSTAKTPPTAGVKKRGPNVTEVVDVGLSHCSKCQSTERTAYTNTTEREIGGLTSDGRPYTHILWRSTKCATCGQARRDRCFENRKSGS